MWLDPVEVPEAARRRTAELVAQWAAHNHRTTDRMFARLMAVQWLAGVLAALWIAPRTWSGAESSLHPHLWAAVLLGGALTAFPVLLAWLRPGATVTRHVIAVGQVLTSALLIHLTGGRIETHFHVFASLVFLSFYRDWRVLASASLVVAADHFLRGLYFPQSVYGVLAIERWRWLEHAGWVLFEDFFLIRAILRSNRESQTLAMRQAQLEATNERIEAAVAARTEALQASQAQLAEAQRVARIGSWACDLGTGEVRWSDEMFRIHGWAPGEVAPRRGQHMSMVVEEDRARAQALLDESLGSGRPFQAEYRLRGADGLVRTVQTRGHLVAGPGGGLQRMFGTCQDVTERIEAEREQRQTRQALDQSQEQLRHAQKMEAIGRLAGGVAHDFNNLLSGILCYSHIVLGRLDPRDPLQRQVRGIAEAAERAAGLTKQLLAFSRKQVLETRVLDLATVVSGLVGMLQRLIGEHIELVNRTAAGLGNVRADPGQLEQVIMNLAVNARDAMPRGGTLTIETAAVRLNERTVDAAYEIPGGSYVVLAVSDTGCGMDEATRARIFEPFFTTKELGKGTGLGLSTVYGIVRQSGGHVWVYSEPGRGTTFKIYLPRVDDAVDADEADGRAGGAVRGSETVLVVEDEPMLREIASDVLRERGYSVLEAAHGGEALLLCERHRGPIHLMLTDVVMPHLSGRELHQRVSSLRPEMRVLYMSGYTDHAMLHGGGLPAGAAFLQKPFTPDVLAARVREALDAGVAAAAAGRP